MLGRARPPPESHHAERPDSSPAVTRPTVPWLSAKDVAAWPVDRWPGLPRVSPWGSLVRWSSQGDALTVWRCFHGGDARTGPLVGGIPCTFGARLSAGNSPVIAGQPPAVRSRARCGRRSRGGCAGGLLRPLLIPEEEGSASSESVQVRTPRRSRESVRPDREGSVRDGWSAGCWQRAGRVVRDSGGDLLPFVLGHGRAGSGAGGGGDGVRVDLPGDHGSCAAAG